MEKHKVLLLTLVAFLSSLHVVQGYNILFMLPSGSRSHKNVFDPVAQELGQRGHKVVIFSGIEEKIDPPGVTNILGRVILERKYNLSLFQGTVTGSYILPTTLEMINEMVTVVFTDPFISDLVKQPIDPITKRPKFDVVVVNSAFNDFALALGYHMGVPNILFCPSTSFHHHAWNLNVPHPLSYVPTSFSDNPDSMNFASRALSTFQTMAFYVYVNYIFFPTQDAIIRKYLPNVPPLMELNRNVSFMLGNSHPAIHVRKPGMPYTAEVGRINCKKAKPLPKDLEDYVQKAGKDGVIYFSLGSATPGSTMPLEMRDKVMQAFSTLPQKIIWKYEKDIPNLPKNIKLVKWAPQQDLLAHPQVKLFITHGGMLSTNEAIYHGCPILAFPLSVDQLGNVVQAKRIGVGDYLDWQKFTVEEMKETISRLINDKSYRQNSQLSSTRLKDALNPPVDVAVYWIEYVIRHRGASFLKSSAIHLNFFQYFLIDVLALLIVVLIGLGVALFYIVRCICRFLFVIYRYFAFSKKSAPKMTNGYINNNNDNNKKNN